MVQEDGLMKLSEIHIQQAANVFTDAFMEYPLFRYLVENPSSRSIIYPLFFRLMTKYTVKFGEAYATSENMEGIALWLPAEKADISLWNNLTNGGIDVFLKAGLMVTYRSMIFTDFASRLHHQLIEGPHIYLFQIGVQRKYRGKGYASKLMKPILNRADRENLPIYLETHDQTNIPLYKHFQFEIAEHKTIPGSNVNHWTMIRPKKY